MTAPLTPERCVCQATAVTDTTLAEHAVWCPSRKPTAERLAEIKSGAGRPLMAGELEWLRGDANRNELHVIGARGGHWPLTDDLPGAVLDLARKLGAMVAEVDRLRAALNRSENDLTGTCLSLWEEEQDARRLRTALSSAQRGRRKLRAQVERLTTELAEVTAHRAHVMGMAEERVREATELREQAEKVAAFVAQRAEVITAIRNCHPDNSADYNRWQGHAEARRVLAEQLGLPIAWPTEAGDPS